MSAPIAIAVSGGIDSMVAAHLLKKRGRDVFGVHFLTGYEAAPQKNAQAVETLCRQLSIPLTVLDLQDEFARCVVRYFADAYGKGQTPNPCMVCNPFIKFGVLLDKVVEMGASHLATGHYARVAMDDTGRWMLCKGADGGKDQSYFLARLKQSQLSRVCFPLGDWTKAQVCSYAAKNGLVPASATESQDVCFIPDGDYAEFLVRSTGMTSTPGQIVDTHGRPIGTHSGLHRYTVGQRRGINCPASRPYYVIRMDATRNQLVVGFKEQCYCSGCRVESINWIVAPPEQHFTAETRIRYRHRAVMATIRPQADGSAKVVFDDPQTAVTPGQAAVFYQGDNVLGGGWIVESEPR